SLESSSGCEDACIRVARIRLLDLRARLFEGEIRIEDFPGELIELLVVEALRGKACQLHLVGDLIDDPLEFLQCRHVHPKRTLDDRRRLRESEDRVLRGGQRVGGLPPLDLRVVCQHDQIIASEELAALHHVVVASELVPSDVAGEHVGSVELLLMRLEKVAIVVRDPVEQLELDPGRQSVQDRTQGLREIDVPAKAGQIVLHSLDPKDGGQGPVGQNVNVVTDRRERNVMGQGRNTVNRVPAELFREEQSHGCVVKTEGSLGFDRGAPLVIDAAGAINVVLPRVVPERVLEKVVWNGDLDVAEVRVEREQDAEGDDAGSGDEQRQDERAEDGEDLAQGETGEHLHGRIVPPPNRFFLNLDFVVG